MIHKVLVILLCVMLILGVYGALNDGQVPRLSSTLNILQNSQNTFESDWVDDIRIPDLDSSEYPLISGLIDFINDFLLAPIRFIITICVMGLNVFAFVINYYSTFFA